MTDWRRWHHAYDDPSSSLTQRLRAVRQQVAVALERAAPGTIRLLSLCAGEGRDVLPVLAAHPRGVDVAGRLVELDQDLCARARSAAPASIEVVQGDAGTTTACAGAVPADVLLLCGIFGNVSDEDIARTVAAVPSLLAAGGTVIWTRHTRDPDRTPLVRWWLAEAGVQETAFLAAPRPGWAVGAGVPSGPPITFVDGRRLFTFRP